MFGYITLVANGLPLLQYLYK